MKLKPKLIAVFIAISLLSGLAGYFGLLASNQIIETYDGQEKHISAVIESSNEVSSYAKRAEAHMMMYLTLHNDADKQKYFKRLQSLRNQTSILYMHSKHPMTMKILENITLETGELQSLGESLIINYDNEINETGKFDLSHHEESIRRLNEITSNIRRYGLDLSRLELGMQAEHQEIAKQKAAFYSNIILIISIMAVIIALGSGYFISESIANPLTKLKGAANRIALGNLGTRLEINSGDELGELAESINKMAKELQKSRTITREYDLDLKKEICEKTKELESSKKIVYDYSKLLEKEIKEKTKALEKKVSELERFKKLAVGRELKMIELKKKIRKLGGKE